MLPPKPARGLRSPTMRSKGREADCDVPPAPNPGGGPAPHYAKGGRAKKWVEAEGGKGRKRLDRPGRAKGGKTEFRTKSGSVSAGGRREAEAAGQTMPGGGFPIRNASDLSNAKHDVGRAKSPAAARRWINKRAHKLGEPALGESTT